MRALVLYETMTGNTRLAAQLLAVELLAAGMPATLAEVGAADQAAVDAADLVVVGTWTDGFLVVGQRPGAKRKLRRLPSLTGKRAAVYCTYAVNPGDTVHKLTRLVADLGAEVVGGRAVHRRRLSDGARELADLLLALPPPADPPAGGQQEDEAAKDERGEIVPPGTGMALAEGGPVQS